METSILDKIMAITVKVCKMSEEEMYNRIDEIRTMIDSGVDDLDIKLEEMALASRIVEEENIDKENGIC